MNVRKVHHTRDVTAECNTYHTLYDVNEYLVYVERLKQKLLLSIKKKKQKLKKDLQAYSVVSIYM